MQKIIGRLIMLIAIFCAVSCGGNDKSSNSSTKSTNSVSAYYEAGYRNGQEAGLYHSRIGDAYSASKQAATYNFFRKYSLAEGPERDKALEDYQNGYMAGYEYGWSY